MAKSVELAIANLQAKSLTAGCANAPSVAIEQMGPSPFSLAFEQSGTTDIESYHFAIDFAVIVVQHHVSRNILPADIAKAASLRDTFLKSIRDDPTLGGTCDTVTSIKRRFGEMKFGTMSTVGYQYEIGIKIVL